MIDIIIAVYGKSKFLPGCIESIKGASNGIQYGIALIDTLNPERIPLAKAWNDGTKNTNGEILLFLNDDTKLSKDVLLNLQKELLSDESIGVVAPTVSLCAHIPQTEPFKKCKIAKEIMGYSLKDVNIVADKISNKYHQKTKDMDFDISSCCLMMRRSTWELVGGFCEEYNPAYGEDNDFIDSMMCGVRSDFNGKFKPLRAKWVQYLYVHHFRQQTAKIVPDLNRNRTDQIFFTRFEKRHGITYQTWRRKHYGKR